MRNASTTKSNIHAKCLICQGNNLVPYFDCGKTALANSFLKKQDLSKKEQIFPLEVVYCQDCHLVQLGYIVNRKLLFREYAWFSGASSPLEEYFKEYANTLKKVFPKQSKGLVVEIGSNDGILLKNFKKTSKKIIGIDPAKNIARIANKNGIPTMPVFWNTKVAEKILTTNGPADIIIANHVLAHTDNLHDMVHGIRELLAPNGVFTFEVQYISNLLEKNQFDNTYHEHVCYFSLSPLVTLLEKNSLKIIDVNVVGAQGGSIRVYATHKDSNIRNTKSLSTLLQKENRQGLHNLNTYKKFSKEPEKIRKDLLRLLTTLKKKNKKIVGYGASAKGNTLLQYSGIGKDLIRYIIDTTPSKQGKYTPGTHIPIYTPEYLKKDRPDYILILSWNYADLIIKKEVELRNQGVKFIVPIPHVHVI